MLTLYPETNIYSEFSGIDFDRISIHDVAFHQLSDDTALNYLDCADRMIKPGGSYILAIRLADDSFYDAGSYGDTDDEGHLPTPLAPHKLNDLANHGRTSRKRQR